MSLGSNGRRKRTRRRPSWWLLGGLSALVLSFQLGVAGSAFAGGTDFSLDFIAAVSTTYNHTTGIGGEYDNREIGTNVVEQLEGGDFTCGDAVVFFTAVTVDSSATGPQDIQISYAFDTEPTGQPGAGYVGPVAFSANTGDSGMQTNGDEIVSKVSESTNSTLDATAEIDNLDPGEVFILRIVVHIGCEPNSSPTGNLLASLTSAQVVPSGDAIGVGNQTIPLMHVEQIVTPPTTPPPTTPPPSATPTGAPQTGAGGTAPPPFPTAFAVLAGAVAFAALLLVLRRKRRV